MASLRKHRSTELVRVDQKVPDREGLKPVAPVTPVFVEEGQPWERQPYDTEESWAAFLQYRDQRRPRQLYKATEGRWQTKVNMYRDFNWGPRVMAHDRYYDAVAMEEHEAVFRSEKRALAIEHMILLKDAQGVLELEIGKLLRATKESEFATLRPGELQKLLETVIKYQRLVSDQSTENVAEVVDVKGLSVDELREMAALHRKAGLE